MKGLLYKDFLTMWRARLLLIYFVVVICVSFSSDQNMMMLLFPCFFAATLPMTMLSYDEKSHWNQYAQALPVTRVQQVTAKYVLAVCLVGLFSILTTVSKSVTLACKGQWGWFDSLGLLLMLVSVGLVLNALIMPFVFKFGTEKGALLYYAVLVVCGGGIGMFYGINGLDYTGDVSVSPMITAILFGVAVLLFAVSRRLSVWFFNDREL